VRFGSTSRRDKIPRLKARTAQLQVDLVRLEPVTRRCIQAPDKAIFVPAGRTAATIIAAGCSLVGHSNSEASALVEARGALLLSLPES
jgi:hypothetical protein